MSTHVEIMSGGSDEFEGPTLKQVEILAQRMVGGTGAHSYTIE